MSEDIKINDSLLEIYNHVSKANNYCCKAAKQYNKFNELFMQEYSGKANEDSAIILNSVSNQIIKLSNYYSMIGQFVFSTLIGMISEDEELSKLIESRMGE